MRTSVSSTLWDDLEPLSYDDLPLGGEWTTRRRTVSEAEIALFAGVVGDLSPLTIDTSRNGRRAAPPAMVVAVAVGLGTVDMPIPAIAEWEWLNWKFPRPVHAGDTVYAHWILTQKRPPASGSAASIVVWRVDVHTADGALCAEGEVGAKVTRGQAPKRAEGAPPTPSRGGRRRRRGRANGTTPATAEQPPPQPALPELPAPAAAMSDRPPSSPSRRRRRRRPSGSAGRDERATEKPAPEPAAPATASTPAPPARRGIGGVLRRLRGT